MNLSKNRHLIPQTILDRLRPTRIWSARHLFFGLVTLCILFPAVYAQKEMSIAAIQGDKNLSPFAGQIVRTTGVVTARTRNGFFIQTPDAKIDSDPLTS